MDRYPHLKNAPIAEALIDIQVQLPPNIEIGDLIKLQKSVSNDYPIKAQQKKQSGKLVFGPGAAPSVKELVDELYGVICTSKDGKNIFQARIDGFTFSRLEPYEYWHNLKLEGKKVWEIYNKFLRPKKITRIALRYINKLKLPLPIRDFQDYLTAAPTLPPRMPQEFVTFLTRIVALDHSSGAISVITQALEPISEENYVTVLLDIDVYKSIEDTITEKEMWTILERLRVLKNRIFFNSITEKTEDLCS